MCAMKQEQLRNSGLPNKCYMQKHLQVNHYQHMYLLHMLLEQQKEQGC